MRRLLGWALLLTAAMAMAQTGTPNPSYKLGPFTEHQSATDALGGWGEYWGTPKVNGARYLGFHHTVDPEIGTYEHGQTTQFRVSLEGSDELWLYDAAYEPDGKVIASGWAATRDGKLASYVAQIAPGGKILHVIRTGGAFAPYRVCAMENGLVWVLGIEGHTEAISTAAGSYPLLRQFSFSKGLVRTGMPRSLVTAMPLKPFFSFACNSTSATAYFPDTGQLLRFTFADGRTQQWKTDVARPDKVDVLDFAVADNGDLFAVMHNVSGGLPALFYSKPDVSKDKANWMPVVDSVGNLMAKPDLRLASASGAKLMLVWGLPPERKAYTVPIQ